MSDEVDSVKQKYNLYDENDIYGRRESRREAKVS